MNTLASRLRAIVVTLLFFALTAAVLLGVTWMLPNLPLPWRQELASFRPHDAVGALSDLRIQVSLTAAYLTAAGLVVIANLDYCDRMLAIFADVLLMAFAAMVGFVLGFWLILRIAGYQNFLSWGYAQNALLYPAVVFVVSLLPLHKLRANIVTQALSALILLIAAPIFMVAFS